MNNPETVSPIVSHGKSGFYCRVIAEGTDSLLYTANHDLNRKPSSPASPPQSGLEGLIRRYSPSRQEWNPQWQSRAHPIHFASACVERFPLGESS